MSMENKTQNLQFQPVTSPANLVPGNRVAVFGTVTGHGRTGFSEEIVWANPKTTSSYAILYDNDHRTFREIIYPEMD